MLRGVSPLLSPDLLKVLCEMGHGDEIVLADAHFPGHSINSRTLRADGLTIAALLDGIAPLFAFDDARPALSMMQPDGPGDLDPLLEAEYMRAIQRHAPDVAKPQRIARAAFYQQSRAAFAVLQSGDTRPYGNIILRKGVTLD